MDTDSQLITAVDVLPGNAPNNLGALELVEASEANTGVPVAEAMGDAAYGDGDTRQTFADAGRTLIARVPGRPNRTHFPKEDFHIDLETGSCTCPAVPRQLKMPVTSISFAGSPPWLGRIAVHRPRGGTDPDPGMVCPALATGSYLSGGADPPGRGNPTPVVRPGHRPHHARPAGNLLRDHPGRPRVAKTAPHAQRRAAWYDKPLPTFVDAIALVRRHLWLASEGFSTSAVDPDTQELPVALYHRLVDSLAYAA